MWGLLIKAGLRILDKKRVENLKTKYDSLKGYADDISTRLLDEEKLHAIAAFYKTRHEIPNILTLTYLTQKIYKFLSDPKLVDVAILVAAAQKDDMEDLPAPLDHIGNLSFDSVYRSDACVYCASEEKVVIGTAILSDKYLYLIPYKEKDKKEISYAQTRWKDQLVDSLEEAIPGFGLMNDCFDVIKILATHERDHYVSLGQVGARYVDHQDTMILPLRHISAIGLRKRNDLWSLKLVNEKYNDTDIFISNGTSDFDWHRLYADFISIACMPEGQLFHAGKLAQSEMNYE